MYLVIGLGQWNKPYVLGDYGSGVGQRELVVQFWGQVLLYDFPPCGVNDKTSSKNLCCKPDRFA